MSKVLSKKMQDKLEIMKEENPKFYEYLHNKNDEDSTFMKYQGVVSDFIKWLDGKNKKIDEITKCDTVDYAKYLELNEKSIRTCNTKITIVNIYLQSIDKINLIAPLIRVVEKEYVPDERYITHKDYKKLKEKAKENIEIDAILNIFSGTGIRVSELKFFTYEAVKLGAVEIFNKKK